ncbi:MAG: hypothetical protein KDI43_06490 [Gammaproteobacteria bacterium]|nr:hypothetical protein [Gammaproteobacteria bacterium]MCP5316301.1 hypothetical protein [Chromatiaceae bacterium]
MKYQKLTEKLNDLLDLTGQEENKHQDSLNKYFWRLRTEEKKLRQKIKNEKDNASRKRLKKKLNRVNEGYALLDSQFKSQNMSPDSDSHFVKTEP